MVIEGAHKLKIETTSYLRIMYSAPVDESNYVKSQSELGQK